MGEAGAIENFAPEWRRWLQCQGGGVKLLRRLLAGTLCHRARQARIGERPNLDCPARLDGVTGPLGWWCRLF